MRAARRWRPRSSTGWPTRPRLEPRPLEQTPVVACTRRLSRYAGGGDQPQWCSHSEAHRGTRRRAGSTPVSAITARYPDAPACSTEEYRREAAAKPVRSHGFSIRVLVDAPLDPTHLTGLSCSSILDDGEHLQPPFVGRSVELRARRGAGRRLCGLDAHAGGPHDLLLRRRVVSHAQIGIGSRRGDPGHQPGRI